MDAKTCNSCKKRTVNNRGTVTFKCPQCRQYDIVRCSGCRSNAVKYTCPSCNFSGPN